MCNTKEKKKRKEAYWDGQGRPSPYLSLSFQAKPYLHASNPLLHLVPFLPPYLLPCLHCSNPPLLVANPWDKPAK
jgi:hypothetical protein